MLDAALRYAQAGFKVFPLHEARDGRCTCGNSKCGSPAKHPRAEHGSHDATTDEATIRAWWGQWPTANIGMTLEGWVVIDIDPRNGGEATSLPELPDTCYARTGGGGLHYLYRAKPGVRYPGKLAAGVDCKSGPGAYIVVEPSVHVSGMPYNWLDETEPWSMKPAESPAWIQRVRLVESVARPDAIGEGGRNSHLTSLAGSMRRRGMTQEAITAALLTENEKKCCPPLPDEDVRRIASSVSRYEPEKESAKPVVKLVDGYSEALERLWENGLRPGDQTGWPLLDVLYSVAPGMLTIITGWPNSGKSEWLDALLINLARQGWKTAIFSPENVPVELHIAKLIEKCSGKPFADGPTERLTREEVRQYRAEIAKSFSFIENPEDGALSAEEVVDAATPYLSEVQGKRGLVIDPWNELEHWRPANLSETEYVSKTLSFIRNWARRNQVHVWLVAHPRTMRRDDGGKLPIPTPDMISGSAHFWNKADCAITVYRNLQELDTPDVQVYVQKVRFKHIGQRGFTTLIYNRVTGQYRQKPESLTQWKRRTAEPRTDNPL